MLSVLTMMFLGNHVPNCQKKSMQVSAASLIALVGNHISFEEEIAVKITNVISFD